MPDSIKVSSTLRDVEFTSSGVVVRGWLRAPGTAGPHPVVILAHGLGGLKEWTIPDVASVLVDSGIAAMAFDYRNWGDSEGQRHCPLLPGLLCLSVLFLALRYE